MREWFYQPSSDCECVIAYEVIRYGLVIIRERGWFRQKIEKNMIVINKFIIYL